MTFTPALAFAERYARQPRERAVPCTRCRRDTWTLDALCTRCAAERTDRAVDRALTAACLLLAAGDSTLDLIDTAHTPLERRVAAALHHQHADHLDRLAVAVVDCVEQAADDDWTTEHDDVPGHRYLNGYCDICRAVAVSLLKDAVRELRAALGDRALTDIAGAVA